MLEQVRALLQRESLVADRQALWVAVSGGLDSMVLLHVLRAMDHPCHVLHIDHGLRGSESTGDAAFVQKWCADHGIPCRTVPVDVKAYKATHGGSTQMAARALRYATFREVVQQGPNTLALAHHADDAVETFFTHLMRGMGAKGWKTIPPRSGSFIRPLLNVRRAQLEAYAKEHGIPHREDASNAELRYMRNRIRHVLMPLLETMRPGSGQVMVRNVQLLREMDAVVQAQLDALLKDRTPGVDGTLRMPIHDILSSSMPRLVLLRLLQRTDLHPDRLEDILLAMEQGRVGAQFPASGCTVFVDRTELVIAHERREQQEWTIPHPHAVPPGAPLRIDLCSTGEIDLTTGPTVAWLDADALGFPLVLRPWKAGNLMRPIGMQGSKLISDLLIDAKVPRDRKSGSLVLLSGERIVWACGLRIAEGVQATPGSRQVLRLSLLSEGLGAG
ncbi:MAG: tRNA lysidine(34) synthetase TilS [Flavobacteriales bacterium]